MGPQVRHKKHHSALKHGGYSALGLLHAPLKAIGSPHESETDFPILAATGR
jgi:hypothetical protein